MYCRAVAFLLAIAASTAAVGFQTPSGNIHCLYSSQPAYLRCDIRSGLRPEPRARCELDWTGLQLGPRGRGRPSCAGDTVIDRRNRILGYGRRFGSGGLACLSQRVGLRCTNRAGHGFFLSRQSWRAF